MIQLLTPMLHHRQHFHPRMKDSVGEGFTLLAQMTVRNLMESRLHLLHLATEEYVATLDDDDELDTGLQN